MSQNRKRKSVIAMAKGLCKILTPLAWLLAGVLHAKGNEGFPSILGNTAFWLKLFFLPLHVQEGALDIILCIVPNVI